MDKSLMQVDDMLILSDSYKKVLWYYNPSKDHDMITAYLYKDINCKVYDTGNVYINEIKMIIHKNDRNYTIPPSPDIRKTYIEEREYTKQLFRTTLNNVSKNMIMDVFLVISTLEKEREVYLPKDLRIKIFSYLPKIKFDFQ